MKIKITSDSTLDLTPELLEKYNIATIALAVNLGEKTYFDGIDIVPEDIYKYFDETGELPKTGARSPEDYKDFFQKYLDEGYEIVHVGIGSELSCSYGNCRLAAQELKGVYTVDSQTLSSGTGLLALYASDLTKSGKYSAKEIAEKVSNRAKASQSSFIIEKLKFLHKGGRCSMLSVLGANILRIKPCIQVVDGKNTVARKYMGNMISCVKKYCEDTLKIYNTPDHTRVMITYSTATPEMLETAKEVLESYGKFKEILITQAGSVINSHCGRNTLGVLYLNDGDEGHM